jgi:L-rhamnose mutarotase
MSDWGRYHVSAFVLHVREGRTEEYRRRHAALWPEMADALRVAGIVHYDIFLDEAGRRVFGHQLRLAPPDPAAPEHPVILRWRQSMADILEMDGDRPRRTPIEHVFHLTA